MPSIKREREPGVNEGLGKWKRKLKKRKIRMKTFLEARERLVLTVIPPPLIKGRRGNASELVEH